MKNSVTKFDFEAAFKALDEIEIPKAEKGIKENRAPLTEIFSKKTKTDSLIEDYYNVNDSAELEDAKEARDAEIAKAKLARIEKIVDLEAETEMILAAGADVNVRGNNETPLHVACTNASLSLCQKLFSF